MFLFQSFGSFMMANVFECMIVTGIKKYEDLTITFVGHLSHVYFSSTVVVHLG
jgi:hypothetical protein